VKFTAAGHLLRWAGAAVATGGIPGARVIGAVAHANFWSLLTLFRLSQGFDDEGRDAKSGENDIEFIEAAEGAPVTL